MKWLTCPYCNWNVCVGDDTTTIDPYDCACSAESINPCNGTKKYKEE